MAIKFEKIQAGMTLYDRHRERMGNTTIRSLCEWSVEVISVDAASRTARASWNGNPEETWSERDLRGLHTWSMYDEGAEVVRGMMNSVVSVKRKPKAALRRKESK